MNKIKEVRIASDTNPMKAAASIIHFLDAGYQVGVTAVGRAERVARKAVDRVRAVLERQGRQINIGYEEQVIQQCRDRLPDDDYLRWRAQRLHPEFFRVVRYNVSE
jgi:siroheme synthase (precorrin-2 oxidase/ferrochelatase)